MKTERIPVTLLSGFLGAGKTTYLNARLRDGIPAGSLILVNDFGDINIDAELIEYRDEQVLRLSKGCICCTLGGSLAEQLAQILRMEPAPAAIYIEASGIADPARIVDTIAVSPRLRLAELVCLVDASQAERHAGDPLCAGIWRRQIGAANRVVVNRIGADEPFPPVLAVALHGRDVAVERQPCAVPPRAAVPRAAAPVGSALGLGHASNWQQCSVRFDAQVDGERLATLLHLYADVVIRAKGILRRNGHAGAEVLQWSGTTMNWSPSAVRAPGGQLVCIGASGERFAEFADALRRLRHDEEAD